MLTPADTNWVIPTKHPTGRQHAACPLGHDVLGGGSTGFMRRAEELVGCDIQKQTPANIPLHPPRRPHLGRRAPALRLPGRARGSCARFRFQVHSSLARLCFGSENQSRQTCSLARNARTGIVGSSDRKYPGKVRARRHDPIDWAHSPLRKHACSIPMHERDHMMPCMRGTICGHARAQLCFGSGKPELGKPAHPEHGRDSGGAWIESTQRRLFHRRWHPQAHGVMSII